MARSNYAAKSTDKTSAKKADAWLNLTYVNKTTNKRTSLGGIPLTASESGFHENLIAKLQAFATAEEQAAFALKVLQNIVVSVTFPSTDEAGADYGLDSL